MVLTSEGRRPINVNVIYIHMEQAMPETFRIPYVAPMPWLVIGGVIGVALIGAHHLGGIIVALVALGFAYKWAVRWHTANGGPGFDANHVWPSCAGIWGRRRSEPRPAAEPPSSGNHAFDDYRREMLRRLEQDHQDFNAFLERLRQAKDKAEFDQFMADRSRGAPPPPNPPTGPWPTS
jgi:hypothetical protein